MKKNKPLLPKPSAKAAQPLTKSSNTFPVVGIGASAGGLDAFKKLLKAIPENSGMAFVLVQHLDPKHESMLPELLQKVTTIPVLEIADDIKVQPNHIYIIPSNKMMTASDGVLKLSPRPSPSLSGRAGEGLRNLPVDLFFTSLAEVHQSHSIGVVLSGTASDGTKGLKAIKDHGGITFAQSEESAAYDGMPHSAIQAGVVDFILPPEAIPQKLMEIIKITNGNGGEVENLPQQEADVFKQMLALLRLRKGTDFTYYKQTTIRRRIFRRMALNKNENPAGYLKYLRENKNEQDMLFQDLLIPVTSFFRDPKSFDHLCETVFPQIIKTKKDGETIRVWIAGCSTGQEVYSIAICLKEFLGDSLSFGPDAYRADRGDSSSFGEGRGEVSFREGRGGASPLSFGEGSGVRSVQIFATDLSEPAIAKARSGIYSKIEAEELSSQRLKEFFTKNNGSYQLNKSIRDMCVFAVHNFLKDPPFGKMDLISCRNVLIYMEPYLQKKALTTFHYALNNNGFLLLGKSETISSVPELFSIAHKGDKLFSRKDVPGKYMHTNTMRHEQGMADIHLNSKINPDTSGRTDFQKTADDIMLSKYTPAGVVVNEAMDIVHFRGKTGNYLEQLPGKPSHNLLKMAKEGLAFELRNILHNAKKEKKSVTKENIPVNINGNLHIISIEAMPLPDTIEPHFLVLFHEVPQVPTVPPVRSKKDTKSDILLQTSDIRIKQLEKELAQAREDMRSITEDQEAANEELQSANEELLSGSEELQSLNEELETGKEELQSTNEELMVVNQEMIALNEQIKEAKDYAETIIANHPVPLLVLDRNLRIKTANIAFYKTFLVNETETEDRLIYQLGNNQWDIPALRKLLENILPQKSKFEGFEVSHKFKFIGQRTMLLNAREILRENQTEKLILLAIEDITERAEAERNRSLLANIINTTEDAIVSKTLDGIITSWNTGAEKIFGYIAKEVIGRHISILIPPELLQEEDAIINEIKKGQPKHYNTLRIAKNGSRLNMSLTVSPIKDKEGNVIGASKIARDITAWVTAIKKIEDSEQQIRKELNETLQLHKISTQLINENDAGEIYRQILAGAKGIMDSDCASMQLIIPETNELSLLAHCGLHAESELFWSKVSMNEASSCAKALHDGKRIIIPDVENSDFMAGTQDLKHYRLSGIRAVQSTPLISHNGIVMGMISTHWKNPHQPTEKNFLLFDVLARQATDLLERRQAEKKIQQSEFILQGQKQALEQAVNGEPLSVVLETIIRTIEEQSNNQVKGSVLLADKARKHLVHGAAPSLPQTYNQAIDGIAIGPAVGSCGTAAFTCKEVVVTDIEHDPLWKDFKNLALPLGLRACWSTPILSSNDKLLATFALYYPKVHTPSQEEREIVALLSRTAGVVIEWYQEILERQQANQKIKASEEQFRLLVLQAPVAICVLRGVNYVIETINEGMVEMWGKKPEDVLNKPAFDVLPELLEQGFKDLLDNVYHTGERFVIKELPINLQRNGQLESAFIKFIYEPLRDADGTVSGVMALAHEITEQVLLRKRIEESETKFRTLIKDAPVATCLFTGREMTVAVANDIMIGYWGKDKNVIGKTLRDAVPELIGQPFLGILEEVFTTGKVYEAKNEYAQLEVKGVLGEYYFDYTYKPIFSAAGEVYGIMDMAVDVTEQVLSRKKLEASEQNFRQLADLMPEKVTNTDAEGNVTYFNQNWLDYTGLSFEELKDWGWEKIMHPDDMKINIPLWKDAIEKGIALQTEERIKNKTGEYRWHLSRVSPVKDDNGKITKWISTTTEIQEQKDQREALEKAVRESTQELLEVNEELVQKNQEIALSVYNKKFLTEFSERFAAYKFHDEFFNAAVTYVAELTHIDYVFIGKLEQRGADEFAIQTIALSAFGKLTDNINYPLPDGPCEQVIRGTVYSYPENCMVTFPNNQTIAQFKVEGYIGFPLYDAQENAIGLIAVMHSKKIEDPETVSSILKIVAKRAEIEMERIKYEQALEQNNKTLAEKNEELKKMNHELESFTYVSSHDLQEPLRKIQTFAARILEKEFAGLSDTGKDYFHRMSNAARRMQTLIEDLLTYSHTNLAERKIEKADLDKIVEQVKDDLTESIQEKAAVIEAASLGEASINPFQFRQVMNNLISNALKFSKPGVPPHIIIRSETGKGSQFETEKLTPEKMYCHILVSDNGIGFDPEYKHKIFEVFQRLHGKEEYKGTGIGLAIVKKIVENHDGIITATGEPGKGARFDMYIPA